MKATEGHIWSLAAESLFILYCRRDAACDQNEQNGRTAQAYHSHHLPPEWHEQQRDRRNIYQFSHITKCQRSENRDTIVIFIY